MLTVASTHGRIYHQGGHWAIQCRFTGGEEGIVTARRLSVLRRRLKERGVSQQEIERLSAERVWKRKIN